MINVTYSFDHKERRLSLLIKGHAGQADEGHDIICASASILAYTAAQIISSMNNHKDLDGEPVINMKSGDANIYCCAKDDYIFAEMLTMFFSITTGYRLLAHNYPQYIKYEDVTPNGLT